MTVERYNTPNHPRWESRTTAAPTRAACHRKYGQRYSGRDGRRTDGGPRSEPPLFLSRDETEDDTTIELRDTPERTWITADLPDRSIDDVRAFVSGASLRIRAEPADGSSRENCFDRTIELAGTVDPADVVIAYDEPTLTVIVSNENQ